MKLEDKFLKLKEILQHMESAVVAFSGGVDSTFLLKAAVDTLDDKVLGVIADYISFPEREFKEAQNLANDIGANVMVIKFNELDIPEFRSNSRERCYFCKKELFTKISLIAKEKNYKFVTEGSNTDDLSDYRPGLRALKELKIRSPLVEAEFSKNDIREMSRRLELPTWKKPSFACLASRIPYGVEISRQKLEKIRTAEELLRNLGFEIVRVRDYDDMARIEVGEREIQKFLDESLKDATVNKLKELGYKYITIDLEGYRTGSMNVAVN